MKRIILLSGVLLVSWMGQAQKKFTPNYDESKVPQYTLPDVLTCNDGTKVTTKKQWEKKRRPEIMEMFQSQMFGRTPQEKIPVTYEQLSETTAFEGKATIKEVRFHFQNNGKSHDATLMLVLPSQLNGKKCPVFVGLNFKGNKETLMPDGANARRWDYERIVDRGYAVATMHYNDIYPDQNGKSGESLQALFSDYSPELKDDTWQAIGTWAWGVSRIADYLETLPWVNKKELAVIGHSRLGKTSLWAGAQDPRFKVVISNDSGCGGAAISRRCVGETVWRINTSFPHWFCKKFREYNDNESALPFDQHELLALVAPRAVYVASAEMDDWADQRGEFLAASAVGDVYHLYGLLGLETKEMPGLHQPIMKSVGYHIRQGVHDVTNYDWRCYLDFCDRQFKKK